MVMTHETQRCYERKRVQRGVEGGWEEEKEGTKPRGGKGDFFFSSFFLEKVSLKIQEDCYSTRAWPLFPACIWCLGNTKLTGHGLKSDLFVQACAL